MTLNGIQMNGDRPIDGGSFGEIWRGLLGDQEIAVKVLRIYRPSDKEQILKVGPPLSKFVIDGQIKGLF
jgi:hypothetical protein